MMLFKHFSMPFLGFGENCKDFVFPVYENQEIGSTNKNDEMPGL